MKHDAHLGEGPELLPTMQALTSSAVISDPNVQQAAANLVAHASAAEQTSWKLRMRTRDLLKVMNCVQCNLCRLHGKVLACGLASALQARSRVANVARAAADVSLFSGRRIIPPPCCL